MKKSLQDKLDHLLQRHQEIAELLSQTEIINDQNRFRDLSKEYSRLEPVVGCYKNIRHCQEAIDNAQAMLQEADPEMAELANEELNENQETLATLEQELKTLLIPHDPNDERNIYLEIRAGTGGDEASLFAGDLFRMYSRYAELQGWQVEIINSHPSEQGGYKEVVARISGQDVYSRLKFESGAHRVQRVPATETQGRIHTSACTVAVLPEVEAIEAIDIDPSELKIDTFRASGAGGQHVNVTDSAVRITHLPTGVVVECQDERSQHKNKAKAMAVLRAKILDAQRMQQEAEQAQKRKSLVGSGDRSERIRTYNFPQGRMTDHRINLTLYKLNEIIEGQLEQVIEPLIREHQADLLSAMGEEDA